jgi:ABC-type dipeptide/oligopeptide/nickel transport system permease subunit
MFVALGAWVPPWLGDREGFRAHEATAVATLQPAAPRPSDPDRPATREANGLDRASVFARGIVSGELTSARDPAVSLGKIVHEGLFVSSGVALVGLACALLFGLPAGLALTRRPGRGIGLRIVRGLVLAAESMPAWVVGPVLVYVFASTLAWLAPARWDGPETFVLPGIAIGLPVAAVLARAMARAPIRGRIADVAGASVVALLVSQVAVEVVFSIPGLGQAFIRSVLDHDIVMASGLWAWLASIALLVRFLAGLADDLLPRPAATDPPVSAPNPAAIARRKLISAMLRSHPSRVALFTLSAAILLAFAGPTLASLFGNAAFEGSARSLGARPPSWAHLFGTDKLGRDLLVQVLAAMRSSLLKSVAATLAALVVGGSAGFLLGWVDRLRGRAVVSFEYLLSSVPWLVLLPPVIVVAQRAKWSFFGADAALILTVVLLGLISAFSVSRMVRSVTVAAWSSGFADAAQAAGIGPLRIAAAHVAPACLPILGREALRILSTILLSEGFLAFLVGIHRNPHGSLGSLVAEGARVASAYPWLLVIPSLVLAGTAICGFALSWNLDRAMGALSLAPGARSRPR